MPTLNDIARKAGVSAPTVSRILSPKDGVIPAKMSTIQKVRKIAESLNYSPNAAARSLAIRRTDNIGVVLDTLRNTPGESPVWSQILAGVLNEVRLQHLNCMMTVENYSASNKFRLPEAVRQKNVDGLIITHPLGTTDSNVLQEFIDNGVPFVVLSAASSDPRVWSVCCDPNPGYMDAFTYLCELGHRKVGYCVYPQWNAAENREKMFPSKNIFKNYNMEFVPVEVDLAKNSHIQEGQRLAEQIISGGLDITAIVMGDSISAELLNSLNEQGIKVPDDFSIIGLDDTYICQCTSPKLSSLASPLVEMGQIAVRLLQDAVKAKQGGLTVSARNIILPKKFVIRKSTGPLKR
ncbi:Glucose-resistance amylase regulator [Limihaloglobus sulfuriphilus]|uniref:Glucose-resistance amylase regulator n=1 Tax=Limihaloglobus sulfuriphilus TaxID=1851148 RepID=A0A1Q2MCU9_9BACT|nr:LacI family DNA-binding transcriptional regulator [Limihaloglobus sulfuriphilus]AQQ70521.1 Glucose-resistance amylase regulator [Limihaloglobus sulfuriphilus]